MSLQNSLIEFNNNLQFWGHMIFKIKVLDVESQGQLSVLKLCPSRSKNSWSSTYKAFRWSQCTDSNRRPAHYE